VYYVYLLASRKHGMLYIGVTNDLMVFSGLEPSIIIPDARSRAVRNPQPPVHRILHGLGLWIPGSDHKAGYGRLCGRPRNDTSWAATFTPPP
jgi:hypothetical protein